MQNLPAITSKQNINLRGSSVNIVLKSVGHKVGNGYGIDYTRGGEIYRHRLNKSQVVAGKGFILIADKTLNITPAGIVGG